MLAPMAYDCVRVALASDSESCDVVTLQGSAEARGRESTDHHHHHHHRRRRRRHRMTEAALPTGRAPLRRRLRWNRRGWLGEGPTWLAVVVCGSARNSFGGSMVVALEPPRRHRCRRTCEKRPPKPLHWQVGAASGCAALAPTFGPLLSRRFSRRCRCGLVRRGSRCS